MFSDVYHAYEEIVQLVLEVFNTVANRLICYIGEVSFQKARVDAEMF